ncbi:MAG: ATP synthase F1 subunit epsilon [Candidatus Moraniibacteriota bacterium]|nr:MAG: ATP synthase F1 subunit epsilon [Candidatus Moranbacteria bacterium]
MPSLKIKIVTPERSVVELEASAVSLPVIDGEVTILPDHEPYIGALEAGEVIINQADGSTENLAVSGGFVEFDTNTLSILADTAERAEEIDIERAEAARARAERLRHDQVSMGEEEYARVAAAIEKEAARIKIARRHRGRAPLSVIEGENE